MEEKIIKKLKEFIKDNPPLDKEGKPKWWSKIEWEENLSKEIPNWKDLLKSVDVWKEIRGVRPRRDYDDLLTVILKYAPPEILKEYLTSDDLEEREVAYKILTQDNGEKLTSSFWKLLDYDTKIWLISKIFEEVITIKRPYLRFLKELEELLYEPDYFFERLRRRYKFAPWVQPHIITLAFIYAVLYEYEKLNILHPLWIKLKATIEKSNDLVSMKKIEEIEHKTERKARLIIDKLKALFPVFQYIFQYKYPSVSKNVLFDPSLLLDSEKARKVFSFMKEYYGDFNFFIPASFYNILKENINLNKIARFFEQERSISSWELLKLLEEHERYYTIFEIPKEFYKEKYWYFYESLREEVEDKILLEILFEEWVFLQEFSWIVAKSKKTFEKFKEAGAVVIEISKNALDTIIEKLSRYKLNKRDDEALSTIEKLRGLGKWIAHGGITVIGASFINPMLGTLLGYIIGEGLFVLIDPQEIMVLKKDNGGLK